MVDAHHDAQLPVIARLLDDLFSVRRSWLEPKSRTGETPDVFSVVERRVDYDSGFTLYPGQTIVSDYKSSVADLRADATKPWRQPHTPALGDWRMVWLHREGGVRPEQVDEGKGWGVVVFDEHNAEVVRKPEQWRVVAWHAQIELIVRLMDRRGQPGKRDQRKHAKNKLIEQAVALIAEGPLMTGQIKRKIGYKGTKLAEELAQDGRVVQQGVGGNWVIKE